MTWQSDLRDLIERESESDSAFVVERIAAPRGLAGRLFSEISTHFGAYFHAVGETEVCVGLGAANLIRTEGESRFQRAQSLVAESLASIDGEAKSQLRFFGGAAFTPGRDGSGCWADFGDCTFVLPRATYVDNGSSAEILLLCSQYDATSVGVLRRILEEIETGPLALEEESLLAHTVDRQESFTEDAFGELIAAIKSSISDGTIEKVVAARRTTLRLSKTPDVQRVLGRLEESAEDCHRFAFRIGSRTFIGATPGTLVQKRGGIVRTEALAGSRPQATPPPTEELLGSIKDRHEHRLVVESIVTALAQIASHVDFSETPVVRHLRRIAHLHTPIAATLRVPKHILDVVELLHPTPAVGGFPRAAALSWLAENEPVARGWYASPFGYLDGNGDGHFVVALRSALLNGDRVHLFAGAGIVERSDPHDEFTETELKMAAMKSALGLPETSHELR